MCNFIKKLGGSTMRFIGGNLERVKVFFSFSWVCFYYYFGVLMGIRSG